MAGTLPYGPLLGWSWVQGCSFIVPQGATWPFPNMDVDKFWPLIAEDAIEGITAFLERLRVPVTRKHDLPMNIYNIMSSGPQTQKEKNWETLTAHFNELGLRNLRAVSGYCPFFEHEELMPGPHKSWLVHL